MNPSSTPAAMPVLGRGWAFPIAREPAVASPLASSADEASVREAIGIILATRKGERVMRPDFGCNLDRLLFAPNNGSTRATAVFEVREAMQAWEPRIDQVEVKAHAAGERSEVVVIEVSYRVLSTDNRYSLVYPFYLDRPAA